MQSDLRHGIYHRSNSYGCRCGLLVVTVLEDVEPDPDARVSVNPLSSCDAQMIKIRPVFFSNTSANIDGRAVSRDRQTLDSSVMCLNGPCAWEQVLRS